MGPLMLVLDLRERYTGDAETKMVTMTCQVGAGALSQQCNNQSWSLFRWRAASKEIQINNTIILSLFYCKQNLPRSQQSNNQSWSLFKSGQQRKTG